MGFVVEKLAVGQVFPVSMILSVLYTHISSQHLTALVFETFIHDHNDYYW
jgi:hypothetical protein